MENTAKKSARMLASLLVRSGVRHAVVSPGSRNVPLLLALECEPDIETHVIIDERSAAFVALGMSAARMCEPVALCCTSGTAPLNYAPAVAEAFYRGLPLVVITADRPAEWIDQDDSQTILQPGIYSNFIKGTYDIETEGDGSDADRMWKINRTLNDALIRATEGKPGPVHINVRLADPLGATEAGSDESPNMPRRIQRLREEGGSMPPCPVGLEELAERLAPPTRVLIVAGFMDSPCSDAILGDLSRRPNIVVMHEAQSNLHGYGAYIPNIDATLSQCTADELARWSPQIVITMGGSLTSRMLKTWLRGIDGLEHWNIGWHDRVVDCFRKLTVDIPYNADDVLMHLAPLVKKRKSSLSDSYKDFWLQQSQKAAATTAQWAQDAPWSDFKAMGYIMPRLPRGWHLQLSNGTAVRYAQLFDYTPARSVTCNRGVSGIDGCTSAAIGFAMCKEEPVMLISGDMSFQYDLGAMALPGIPPTFKAIVLANGGGGIFRFIPQTRSLGILQRNLVCRPNLPLQTLCKAYGFKYLHAADEDTLAKAYAKLISSNTAPTILEITTDGALSAQVLTEYFNRNKQQ